MKVKLTRHDPQEDFPCLAVKSGSNPEFAPEDVYILARVNDTGKGKPAYLSYKLGSNLVEDDVNPEDFIRLPSGTTIEITQ